MAQNITLLGASYSGVPSVELPKTGGGTASFTDVTDTTASAADVASGKLFHLANGTLATGTASGGGSSWTLLASKSLGTLSTTSTSATNANVNITLTNYNNYDMLIVVAKTNTATNNRHRATITFIMLTGTSDISTKNTYAVASNKWNCKLSSSGVVSSRQSTTAYGIYGYSATVSNGTMTIPFYYRYNSNNTGTINGDYTAYVYGVKLYDSFI